MAVFKPFRAFRPRRDVAAQIAAKPYDVLNSDEAREEVAGNPISFLHVGKPEIDLDPAIDHYDPKVYEKGRENLQKLISDGYLFQEEKPCYYLYAQTMNGRTQYGLVGSASVQDYWDDVIKKHEKTRKVKEEDRANHVRITNAHTGPIFLTYHDVDSINKIVGQVSVNEPEYNFTTPDGITHSAWVINNPEIIDVIESTMNNVDYFYVADGHHRSAAAGIVGRERAEANQNHTGNEEYNYFLAVLFPASHLKIYDYNRVVKDLNGLSENEFFFKLGEHFFVQEREGQVRPVVKGEFGLYIGNKWYQINAKPHLTEIVDPVESLDVSILQKYVLSEILGIHDPRTDERIDFVGGMRGLGELEKRVNSGEMVLAFSMYPTSIEELISIADAGAIMPPKSTWFEPKLRDGLFIHFLD